LFSNCGIVAGEEFVALKKTVAVLTVLPLDDWAVLNMAQFAEIATRGGSNFVVTLLARMTVLFPGKEGRHTRDDIMMAVMVIEVNTLVGFGTGIN
jgi:hypothetical protein